jgi:hypothetical protein
MSDLHLEFTLSNPPPFTPTAPVLCLLGDIGDPNERKYEEFLEQQSKAYKQ